MGLNRVNAVLRTQTLLRRYGVTQNNPPNTRDASKLYIR
jgi:hypothetical protein